MLAGCSQHPNILGLVGLCAPYVREGNKVFVVLQDGARSLKSALLEARALVHDPGWARKNGRASSIPEDRLMGYAREVADALRFLASKQVKE